MLPVKFVLAHFVIITSLNLVRCSIDGLSFMDPINRRPAPGLYPRGEDPCNPLYWYPRNIPEYCHYKNIDIPKKTPPPVPLPIPVPLPMPPPNFIMPFPALPAVIPAMAPIPMPYGIPNAPSNPMFPVAPPVPSYPYPPIYPYAPNMPFANHPPQAGMVPGLPGLVTKDGGINILPFSDAYSDLLENHKNRMIRRRFQKLIEEYEDFPNRRSYRRLKKYARHNI